MSASSSAVLHWKRQSSRTVHFLKSLQQPQKEGIFKGKNNTFSPNMHTSPFKKNTVIDIFLHVPWCIVKSDSNILYDFLKSLWKSHFGLMFQNSQPMMPRLIQLQVSLTVIIVWLLSWIGKIVNMRSSISSYSIFTMTFWEVLFKKKIFGI